MGSGSGSGSGCVMDVAWNALLSLMVPLDAVAMVTVDSGSGVAAARTRVDDGVVVAVGRVGSGRVHGATGRDVAGFATVERVA